MRIPITTWHHLRFARVLSREGNEAAAAIHYSLATEPLLQQSRRQTLRLESKVRVLTHLEEKALESRKASVTRIAADRWTAQQALIRWLARR